MREIKKEKLLIMMSTWVMMRILISHRWSQSLSMAGHPLQVTLTPTFKACRTQGTHLLLSLVRVFSSRCSKVFTPWAAVARSHGNQFSAAWAASSLHHVLAHHD